MGAALETVGLTPRMRDCFSAIERHIAANGVAPTYEELRVALGLSSKSPICRMIEALQARGWIIYLPNKERSISIVPGVSVGTPSHVLPPKVALALRDYCARSGENPSDIVADAVALFLDEAQPRVGE